MPRSNPPPSTPLLLLVLSQWPWPPTSGGRMRTKFLAEALGDAYDVVVLSGDHADGRFPEWDRAVVAAAGRRASQPTRLREAVTALARGRQILLERYERAGMPAALASIVRHTRPDVCVLSRPMFGGFIDAARSAHATVVIDADEDLVEVGRSIARLRAPLKRRIVGLVDALVVGRQQRAEYPRADMVIAGSDLERERLSRYVDRARLAIVPNVVELPARAPEPGEVTALAFVGAFGYAPNEAAALELIDEILPAAQRLGGPDRLSLIGRDPTDAMRRHARDRPEIEITGEVADVRAPLRAAGVLVVPLRAGAGTRVKIIEAAAEGVPVVSTRFGVEGLPLEDERDVLIAETPGEFASAVGRLRDDAALRRRLTAAALTALRGKHGDAAGRAAVRAVVGRIAEVRAASLTSGHSPATRASTDSA